MSTEEIMAQIFYVQVTNTFGESFEVYWIMEVHFRWKRMLTIYIIASP